MTAAALFATNRRVSGILKDLDLAGLRVEVGTDFVAYRNLRDAQNDRSPIYPIFDVSASFIDGSNAFWICAFNDQGELVHTQAIRMLDLSDTTLQEHLANHRHKYLTPGMVTNPDETSFAPLLTLNNIKGRVCYHGEFWLKPGDNGLRGQGFTALMSRLVFEIATQIWSPDFLFGFVPMQLAMKGIPFRYGYTRCEVGSWLRNGRKVDAEEALVWMGRSDLEEHLRTAPQKLWDNSKPQRSPERKSTTILRELN